MPFQSIYISQLEMKKHISCLVVVIRHWKSSLGFSNKNRNHFNTLNREKKRKTEWKTLTSKIFPHWLFWPAFIHVYCVRKKIKSTFPTKWMLIISVQRDKNTANGLKTLTCWQMNSICLQIFVLIVKRTFNRRKTK